MTAKCMFVGHQPLINRGVGHDPFRQQLVAEAVFVGSRHGSRLSIDGKVVATSAMTFKPVGPQVASDAEPPPDLLAIQIAKDAALLPAGHSEAEAKVQGDGKAHVVMFELFVGGKNFFQNDKQWVDAAVQNYPKANRLRVQFASSDYFDLIAKNAQVLPWLALGQNVQFVLDNTLYEIYD